MSTNILVSCATGGLGQLVISSLLAQKLSPNNIFAGVRNTQKPIALEYASKGINVRKCDFTDPSSLKEAMTDIQTLMFISSGALANRIEQHLAVLKAAKSAGVQHIVYTSILGCFKDAVFIATPSHVATELAIKESKIPYTIFRNGFYMEVVPWTLGDALTSGKWNYPGGTDGKTNFVAKSDIAEGLAKVLINLDPHINKTYEITSNQAYTLSEIAPILSKATGKQIIYRPISLYAYKVVLKSGGISDEDVNLNASVAETISSGELGQTDTSLENIIGHKTITLEEFLTTAFKK